jgi:hypothetical protein
MKYKIGDKVIITGELYYSSNDLKPKSYVKDKKTTITRIAVGSRHPYNSTGDLGWCDEKSIRYQEEPIVKKEVEIELIDKTSLIDYLKEHEDKIIMINEKQLKDVLGL